LLEQFSGDPNVEKAMAEIEHAQEIEETFDKDFDGIGLGSKTVNPVVLRGASLGYYSVCRRLD
jgi:hypothetical protein